MVLNNYNKKFAIVFSLAPPGDGLGDGVLFNSFIYNW